jgi:hypothetical protein
VLDTSRSGFPFSLLFLNFNFFFLLTLRVNQESNILFVDLYFNCPKLYTVGGQYSVKYVLHLCI